LEEKSHLYLAVEDSSGGCENICSSEDQFMLISATPIGDSAFTSVIVPACPE